MTNPSSAQPPFWQRWRLTPADQRGAALLLALGLAGLLAYYAVAGGCHGRLVDIDLAAPAEARYQIDINQAELTEFLLLPEIGETLAQRIIDDRNQRGPFKDHEDLRRVRGIGPVTLGRIRPHLLPIHPSPPGTIPPERSPQ
jgi:competence protein ComEA